MAKFGHALLEKYQEKPSELNVDFFTSFAKLYDPLSNLHCFNYQIPAEELKQLHNDRSAWRTELKEGDLVDAIMEDRNYHCSCWSEAVIKSVNKDELYLEFT